MANWPTISGPTALEFPNPIFFKNEKNGRLMAIMRNSRQKKMEGCGEEENRDYLIKGYVLFMSPCARYEKEQE